MLWSTLLKPIYDFPDFVLKINIAFIHQFISVTCVIIAFFSVLLKLKLKFDMPLLLITTIGLIIGIAGSFSSYPSISVFFSHLYYLLMPVLSIHIGILLWKNYGNEIIKTINTIASNALRILIIAVFIYFLLHYGLDLWQFFGYSSGLVFAYILTENYKKTNFNKLYFILDLFTGKRSSLVLWVFLLFKKQTIYFFIFVLLAWLFWHDYSIFMPERYSNVFLFDIADPIVMSYATGGRSNEWISLYAEIIKYPFGWIFGVGLGNSYELYDPITNDFEFRHYSHMTPLTYSYLFGMPLTVILFIYLTYRSYVLEKKLTIGIQSFFTVALVLSPLGASLLVEPLPWMIFGISLASSKTLHFSNLK
jgi:hypothetical protein